MKLNPNQSLAGILEPVFAIRTDEDLGIGDTDGVRQMIDWCQRRGLNILQTLPINETSDDHSPYNAISSLAIEPTTIAVSPERIPDLSAGEFGKIVTAERLAEIRRGAVDYTKVKTLKRELLEAAFEGFSGPHSERARQFESFRVQNASWLGDYVLFRMLMEENENSPAWDHWKREHQTPEAAREWLAGIPEKRREKLERKQLFFAYVQWLAFSQWEAIKAYGTEKKVYLMGDIPFGVSRFSADVWANRALFDLDWSGGAPPEKVFKVDAFTEKWGQNWGVPNYRWDELRRRNFDWWRTRVGNIQKVFHLYRIDHVLGFFRIYSFPWTPDRNAEFLPLTESEAAAKTKGRLPGFKQYPDDTPEHKAANQAQGEEILRVVLESSGETTVIAEDLGVVPDYVHPTLQALGIPGFRIPVFFRDHDGALADPKKYPRLSLSQPATHDHPPLAAAWAELWQDIDAGKNVDANRRELRLLMDFAGLKNVEPVREFTDQFREGFTRAVMNGNSWLVIFQITDVFGLTPRFNVPGSLAATNWSYRMVQTVNELDDDPWLAKRADVFARLAKESGRAG
jgi:4-alpha-glucanotransferase